MLGITSKEIQNQIDSLFSNILLEQQKIKGIKGPDSDKNSLIEAELKEYSQYRGRGFYFNYLSSGKGHGPFTELVDGSIKYDLISGIGFNLLGHSHPIFIKSSLEAATLDSMMVGNLQTYRIPNEFSKTLVKSVVNSRLRHFWFASESGSFANDIALKILWQKQAPKYRLIAFEKAFAGRSVATQYITDKPQYREGQPEPYLEIHRVPHFDTNNPKESLVKTLKDLDQLWSNYPNQFCAIMIELIQGEAGFVYGTTEYYTEIFKWAKEKNIYVWVDEVQSFGRTKQLFAFQNFKLDEFVDIVTVGKALHACGVLYTEELNPRPNLIAGTFNGSLPAILCGHKILNYLLNGNFYGEKGRISELESQFLKRFSQLQKNSCQDKLKYFGGIGTMISFEIGDSGTDITNKFIKNLFHNGIMAFSAGSNPTRIRFLPPLSLTNEHLDEIFEIVEKTILETIQS